MAPPVVSIALPVLNGANTLAPALRSLLYQTYKDWELILIDDGSVDKTLSIAKTYADPRIRLIHDGTNKGLPTRLNQAIGLAQGEFFARMDADDISWPNRLQRQVDFLLQHPYVDLVGTAALVFGSSGTIRGLFPLHASHEEICRRPWSGFYLPHPTWMGRIEWFKQFLYRTDAVRSEDQDLLLRSYKTSRFACLPDILLGYRQDILPLKSILRGRWSFTRAVLRHLATEKKYGLIGKAIVEQGAKAVADWLAITFGLEKLFHRHRASPINDTNIIKEWHRHWQHCQADSVANGNMV